MNEEQLERLTDEIWNAIASCFPISDTIWYNDITTLYDHIYFTLKDAFQSLTKTLQPKELTIEEKKEQIKEFFNDEEEEST